MSNPRFIVRKRPIASFNGLHNAAKSKTLLLLYFHRYQLGKRTGLPVRDIYLRSGCNYNYLLSRLCWWTRWKYISRYSDTGFDGKPVFFYKIAPRGKRFLIDILNEYYPDVLKRYTGEINSFTDFVRQLNLPPEVYSNTKRLVQTIEQQLKEEAGSNE